MATEWWCSTAKTMKIDQGDGAEETSGKVTLAMVTAMVILVLTLAWPLTLWAQTRPGLTTVTVLNSVNSLLTNAGVGLYLQNTADAMTLAGHSNAMAESVFIGMGAGLNSPALTRTVAIGYSAGSLVTNGTQGTFIGRLAGLTASGNNITALGYKAANFAPNVGLTVFVGASAGQSASNSFNSVAVGYSAATFATYSPYTIWLGYQAGNTSTGSTNSIFVGVNAGLNATNADNAILLGYGAGGTSKGLTNSIGIGRGALSGISTTAVFRVAQTNLSTTPLIEGNFTNGVVKVETLRTPSTHLTGIIGAPSRPSEWGGHLWSDGTNLCVVLVDTAGTRTTNKVTLAAWP